mgnify:CR=1 FL=1
MALSQYDAEQIAGVLADCAERGVLTQNAQDELLDELQRRFPQHSWYRMFRLLADAVRV